MRDVAAAIAPPVDIYKIGAEGLAGFAAKFGIAAADLEEIVDCQPPGWRTAESIAEELTSTGTPVSVETVRNTLNNLIDVRFVAEAGTPKNRWDPDSKSWSFGILGKAYRAYRHVGYSASATTCH